MSSKSRQAPIRSSNIDRRRMTQRRSEISDQIRKSRRSERVAKRRFGTSSKTSTDTDDGVSIDQIVTYIRSCLCEKPSPEALHLLQCCLASDASSSRSILQKVYDSPVYMDEIQIILPKVLANVLVSDNSSIIDKLNSARILTNIFAGPPGLATKVFENIISELVRSLASCLRIVMMTSTNTSTSEERRKGVIHVAEQIAWAIGNVCADDINARVLSMERGVLEVLIRTFNTGIQHQLCELCKNTVWALSNLSRGNEVSAMPFLCSNSTATVYGYSDAGVRDECSVLKVNDIVDILSISESGNNRIWDDLKRDVCWLLAFLTAKEDGAVALLCQSNINSPLCSALLLQFSSIIKVYEESFHHKTDPILDLAVDIIPCIRSIGNIATACNGIYVKTFLKNQNQSLSLPSLLAKLIELPISGDGEFSINNSKEKAALSSESTWIAGALLVDAGVIDCVENSGHHPSSSTCSQLCPALCKILSSQETKIDLKREAAFALWNAVSIPPEINNVEDYDLQHAEHLLRDIALFEGVVSSLCNILLHAPDIDANLAALMLISGMLTRLQGDFVFFSNLKRRFSEEGIVDALDKICEKASSSFQSFKKDSAEKAADIAADLIDDFFSEDVEYNEGGENETFEGNFTFNPSPPSLNIAINSAVTSLNIASSSSGIGRGRGKNLPAWMKQK